MDREEDIKLKTEALPVEEQRAFTIEEQLAYIEKASSRNNDSDYNNRPLTTDVIGRGYPINEKEIISIKLVNEAEKQVLSKNPSLKPKEEGFKYYIVEDGRIFKTKNFVIYYGLDFFDMTWYDDANYMSIMYGGDFRFSKLDNFRDYYPIKEKKEDMGFQK